MADIGERLGGDDIHFSIDQPLRVIIGGPPHSGKSTLMNLLEDRFQYYQIPVELLDLDLSSPTPLKAGFTEQREKKAWTSTLADEARSMFEEAEGVQVVLGDSVGLISEINEIISQPADVAILLVSGGHGDYDTTYRKVVRKWKEYYEDIHKPLLVVLRSTMNPADESMFDPQDNYGVIVGMDRDAYDENTISGHYRYEGLYPSNACLEGIVFEIAQSFDMKVRSPTDPEHLALLDSKWPELKDKKTWTPPAGSMLGGVERAYFQERGRVPADQRAESFAAEDKWGMIEEMNEWVGGLGPKAYFEFCYRFDIDPEDAQEMSWFIADHYDAPKVISWLETNWDKYDAESFGADSFDLETHSGHEVQWDDGSFYMTFKEPIDGYGEANGHWYGGERESPDEITLDVEPAWDEETDEEYDVPSLHIQVNQVEYYGIKNHNMSVSPDGVASPELLDAIQEGLAWMVADHADKTVVSREYRGESFSADMTQEDLENLYETQDVECNECGGILNPHSSRGPYKKRQLCDCVWSAESFGAEMKLPKLTQNQMDFLKYKTRWFMAYSAYARGKSDRYWSPEDWKDGKAEQCFTITSDGWGNDNIARRTLKSLLEKKVLYATKTNYFDYDGRIRKSPAQQVNENPDLVSELTSVCLGLTPIGVEIIKREFARRVRDVVGWRIELTLEDGQTAYLSDMPDDVAQSIDDHIEDVKWDIRGEQFGAEDNVEELKILELADLTDNDIDPHLQIIAEYEGKLYSGVLSRGANKDDFMGGFGAESFGAEVLSIVNPSERSENDDPRKLYVSIGFRDGEIYRGYVELDSEYEMDEEGYQRKKAESFGAEEGRTMVDDDGRCVRCGSNAGFDYEGGCFTCLDVSSQKLPVNAEDDLTFQEWADQEMITHSGKESFDDWLDDELSHHGDNVSLHDWGNHELDSHYERYGAENMTRFEIMPSVDVEGIGIVSGPLVREYSYLTGGRIDNYDIYDDDAAEEIMSIPANDPRFPLQEGELELIEAMVYGFNHPRINDSWGELNEDGMFWATKVMETLSHYQAYAAEMANWSGRPKTSKPYRGLESKTRKRIKQEAAYSQMMIASLIGLGAGLWGVSKWRDSQRSL